MANVQRLQIKTPSRSAMVNITGQVTAAVRASGVREGLAVVCVPHTTAGITINENADPDVQHDILAKLEQLVPHHESFYRHNEGNSDSHVKASMVGSSVTVIVTGGNLLLGQWQGIYLCEFDGPRTRQVLVKALADAPAGQ